MKRISNVHEKRRREVITWGGVLLSFLLLLPTLLLAATPGGLSGGVDYRTFFGANSRIVIWIVAELHLMYGAFVLGVPIFAVISEIIGVRTKDERYDRLAHEFTSLLSAAFSTTAALGGLLTFTLFGLYPKFMAYLTDIFSQTYYIYALLFFAEGFTLYFYYYSWDRLSRTFRESLRADFGKWLHITSGILLNVVGTILMLIANAWVSFMMSPVGIDDSGKFVGTVWQAVSNPLWVPLGIHRLLGNIAFGGFIVAAYAAIRFLGSTKPEEKAHYDWMGYVGNFVGIAALIPLPFAGYYLGRELYSVSAVMGNNMMGGDFSWTFIIQAILIGMLFIGGNYYLWSGMGRIAGSERYTPYIKYINAILIVSFAIWLTPHNLPLTGEETAQMGGSQYHPLLKFLGLMPAKNAVVNFIILSTFFSFLIYRRANKGRVIPFSEQGIQAKGTLIVVGFICWALLWWYASYLFTLDPGLLDLPADRAIYFKHPAVLIVIEMVTIALAIVLTFANRGLWAQGLLFAVTTFSVVFYLGVYGFVIMAKANPFLRNIAVSQVLMVLSCLIMNTAIDIFLFKGAGEVGRIEWGKMAERSQFALILMCVAIVMLMGLMGFIRSGLRTNWHIYGVMEDRSAWSFTPTNAEMAWWVSLIVLIFLGSIAFVFWLNSLGLEEEKGSVVEATGRSPLQKRGAND